MRSLMKLKKRFPILRLFSSYSSTTFRTFSKTILSGVLLSFGISAFANSPASSQGQALNFQTDLFTGRLAYQIPIEVPPARQNTQPSVALGYNSGGGNSWCGMGWSLDMGYIERDTTKGSCRAWSGTTPLNQYDDTKGFMVAFQGVNARLINVGGNVYRAEVDNGACLKFVYLNPGWEITDKNGTKYRFGDTAATRIENPNWSAGLGSSTFRWALSFIGDVNGNQSYYTYTKDRNQLYLKQISYNANINAPAVPATHTVNFILDTVDRPDIESSDRGDFSITTAKRLKTIEAKVGTSLVRRYNLTYALNSRNGRSMLTSAVQVGADGTSTLPPTGFTYQDTSAATTYPLIRSTPNTMPAGQAAWSVREAYTTPIMLGIVIIPTPLPPYSSRPWSSPVTVSGSQSLSKISVSVDSQGGISTSGVAGSSFWALTWVYCNTARTITLSQSDNQSASCLWREDAVNGIQQFAGSSVSIPLVAGWSIIHYTGSNIQRAWSAAMTSAIKSQVDIMSPNQVAIPVTAQLSADVNGDGRADIITFDPGTGNWTVALGTGTGFQAPTTWLAGFGANSAAVIGDWNSDGLNDIGVYNAGNWTFATSTGTGFVTGIVPGINFGTGTPLSGDFNGDGWIDLALYQDGVWKVALANRTTAGWTAAPSFNLTWGSSSFDPTTGDFNGDGITDIGIIPKTSGNVGILLSAGSAWEATAWSVTDPSPGQQHLTADLNEDGISDLGFYDKSTGVVRYLPGTGTGFGSLTAVSATFSLRSANDNVQFADFNGDGLVDPAVFGSSGGSEVTASQGKLANQLATIANGLGGKATVQYTPSTQYDNHGTNSLSMLPFPVSTVSSVTVNDGMGNNNTVTYNYKGGMYCTKTREFRGFNCVSATDPLGTKTISYFHQGGGLDDTANGEYLDQGSKAKKGMPYRSEVWGNDGLKYSQTLNKVEEVLLHPNGWYFPFVSQTVEMTFEGLTTSRSTATSFAFDTTTLNLTRVCNHGEVSNVNPATQSFYSWSTNTIYTITSYAALANPDIKSRPQSIKLALDSAGTLPLRESRFLYGGDQRCLLASKTLWAGGTTYNQVERYLYDIYGNVTTTTDAAGISTSITYDSTYQTFPLTQSTASSFVTQKTFDVRSGNMLKLTDPKGLVTESTYDTFFRPVQISTSTVANGTASLWQEKFSYSLGGIVSGISQNYTRHQVYDGVDLVNGHETYTYSDGLGRTIQTRAEAETAGQYRVVDIFYDQRGQTQVETLPFFGTGSAFTADTGQPGTVTEYDPIGRPSRVTPPAGDTGSPTAATTVLYRSSDYNSDPWATTTTDATGRTTKSYHDAYGRVRKVGEVFGNIFPVTVFTSYGYNLAGDLLTVVDSSGNTTSITYDNLGRKTQMVDPDMGTWTYTYDNANRLVTQIDAKNQKVSYTYSDPLGRMTTKDIYNASGTKIKSVTYVYDVSDDPNYTVLKGQLYKMTDSEGWQKNSYDVRGRVLKSGRYLAVNGKTYVTQSDYDDADHMIALTYPGNVAKTAYTYGTAGELKQVASLSGTGATEVFYKAQGFNAVGKVTGVTFGNGLQTTYVYYPNSKRPQRVQTTKPGGGYCQDLSYTYDASANLTSVTDSVYTGTASGTITSIQYDRLQRVTSLTSVAQGTKSYQVDTIGNMVVNSEFGASNYVYGVAGGIRPHAVLSANNKTYSYDACGNMTNRNGQVLAYDEENRLKSAGATTFGYDGNGGRLWRKTSTRLTVWMGGIYEENDGKTLCHVVAGDGIVATFEPITGVAGLIQGIPGMGQVKKALEVVTTWPLNEGRAPLTVALMPLTAILAIWAWGRRLLAGATSGLRIHERGILTQLMGVILVVGIFCATTPQVQAGVPVYGPVFYYYHGDHLGSSSILTDRDGDVVQHYEYTGFGKERFKANTLAFSISGRYTGQVLDEDTGLYYYGARYYDAELGRFIQADTAPPSTDNPQTLNRYAYCGNNPVNCVDPTGHSFWKKLGNFFKQAAGIIISVAFTFMGMPFIGALISSAVSTALNGGSLADFGIGLAIGFAAGFAGGYGAGKLGSFFGMNKAGLGLAMLRGGLSGAIGGAGSAAIYGGNIGMGALMGGAMGAGMGAVVWAKNNHVINKFLKENRIQLDGLGNRKADVIQLLREYGQSPVGQRRLSEYLGSSKRTWVIGNTMRPNQSPVAHTEGNRTDLGPLFFSDGSRNHIPGMHYEKITLDVGLAHEVGHLSYFNRGHPLMVSIDENPYRWWVGQPRTEVYPTDESYGQKLGPVPFHQWIYQY